MDDLQDNTCVMVTREGWIHVQTPEGKEKQRVKEFLKERRIQCLTRPLPNAVGFYWMPVPSAMGSGLLDFIICYRGQFVAAETKRIGDKPTPRQKIVIDQLEQTGACVVWGTAEDIIEKLEKLFRCLDEAIYALDP